MRQTQYKSQSELAKALDLHKATVSRLLQRDDWPVKRSAPWSTADVVAIQRWRSEALREDRSRLDDQPTNDPQTRQLRARKLEAEIQKITAQAQQAELQLARERGELLPRQEVEAGRLARITAVRQAMEQAGTRICVKLQGVHEPAAIEGIVEAEMRSICAAFAAE